MNLDYFTELYASRGDDPWAYRSRFYEQRKRALTVAALPRARYAHLLEVACGNGELAAELAPRCDRLLACDAVPAAVQSAQNRLSSVEHAQVERRTMPEEWPPGSFDCIVVSEVGYYFTPDELSALYQRVVTALSPAGTLLLCHWRHAIDGCVLDGDAVHAAFAANVDWCRLVQHREPDLLLDVWSADATSVAEREGLV